MPSCEYGPDAVDAAFCGSPACSGGARSGAESGRQGRRDRGPAPSAERPAAPGAPSSLHEFRSGRALDAGQAAAPGPLGGDFFSVETVSLQRLYVLFFIEQGRRQAFLAGVTAHPDGRWTTQQARNLVVGLAGHDRRFKFLVRDRDAKFVDAFDAVFVSDAIRVIKTPVRAPKANAYAER